MTDSKIDKYVSIISRLYLMSVEDRVSGVFNSLDVGVREDGIVVLQGSFLDRADDENSVRHGYIRPRDQPLVALRHIGSGKEIVSRLMEFLPLIGFELTAEYSRIKGKLDILYRHEPIPLTPYFGTIQGYD